MNWADASGNDASWMAILGFWGSLLAAAAFGAAGLWRLRTADGRGGRLFAAALVATALWAALGGPAAPFRPDAALAEAARNLLWLAWLRQLVRQGLAHSHHRALRFVWAALAGVAGAQCLLALAGGAPGVEAALARTHALLSMMLAAGALVFLHNVYGALAAGARAELRLPALGLATLWAFDLNLFTTAFLLDELPVEIAAVRGMVAALACSFFALTPRAGMAARVSLSRAATFQSLSLGLIAAYLLLMSALTSAGGSAAGTWARAGQAVAFAVLTALAGAAILFPAARARMRVTVAKHLFQHRYDYRAEWLRYSATLAGEGPIGPRIARALADIADAPGACLLRPSAAGMLGEGGGWNAPKLRATPGPETAVWAAALARTDRIVDLQALRRGNADPRVPGLPTPDWLLEDERFSAAVPLRHGELVGVVLIVRPLIDRPLDWEDFDLLRVAARGAAAALAQAQGQERLAEAERFDEFNRRFAFILHDIKNMVSGLQLLARNAARHADNPAFQADMVATLADATARMHALLARLASREPAGAGPTAPTPLVPLVRDILARMPGAGDVRLLAEGEPVALCDAAQLAQALEHLVQNALDASPPGAPVLLRVREAAEGPVVQVIDHGAGMSPAFVEAELFRPFSSTKPGGFGVGAHEARALVAGMGGTLAVDSREGEGTRFTVTLPSASTGLHPQPLMSSEVETSAPDLAPASLDCARDERKSGCEQDKAA